MEHTEAIEEIDKVLELCEELPERAETFREGVEEKLNGMRDWIEENKHCTDPQATAIENIGDGVRKWLR